jgi:hypothetical protein
LCCIACNLFIMTLAYSNTTLPLFVVDINQSINQSILLAGALRLPHVLVVTLVAAIERLSISVIGASGIGSCLAMMNRELFVEPSDVGAAIVELFDCCLQHNTTQQVVSLVSGSAASGESAFSVSYRGCSCAFRRDIIYRITGSTRVCKKATKNHSC